MGRSNLDFEIIPESEFREMSIQEEEGTLFTIRHGWVIDSVAIDECKVGTSQGGQLSTFRLRSNENILTVSADRVRFESRICLSNLKFVTSQARTFGPFSNPRHTCSNLRPVATIEFDINSINEIKFVPTADGKLVNNIKKVSHRSNRGMEIELRSGWIVDSISFCGNKRGASTGGNLTKINLNCLARLKFRTSNGRVFGPFGSAPTSNCLVKGNIDLSVNSIHELKFGTTRDNKFIRDFQIKN